MYPYYTISISTIMRALIFGSTGSIGSHVYKCLEKDGVECIGTTTKTITTTTTTTTTTTPRNESINNVNKMICVNSDTCESLQNIEKVDIVVWCHGRNFNDTIDTFDASRFEEMMQINVGFVLETLKKLLSFEKINNGAKMVIISSIWEEFSRPNKLSYSISKACLSGMVKNLAYDLAKRNILINNVLPGVIDNEMSRKTLGSDEFAYIRDYTPFGRFISLEDIYQTIKFLVLHNSGITGQSIKVDLGFTNIRKYS